MVQDLTGIIGIIIGIVGVLLGFFLNMFKEWYNNRNQTKLIQKLIKYEIDHNLKLIEDLFNEMKLNSKENEKEKYDIIRDIPLPPLNNGMYTKFALSMSNVPEFEIIYDFYRYLDDLKFKYNKMILILSKDHSFIMYSGNPTQPGVTRPGSMPESDIMILKELSNEFEEIIIKLLNKGNPIKKK
jgi:hypothetical protein